MKPASIPIRALALVCGLGSLVLWAELPGLAAEPAARGGPAAPSTPPALPVSSPVAEFRRWLEMAPAEREKALAGKSPKQRAYLDAKLLEYAALSPQERDAKLRVAELHWHLRPLMEREPAERPLGLPGVPESLRPLIGERLAQWDSLPAELKKQVLAGEVAMSYFDRFESSTPEQREDLLSRFPAERRQKIEAELDRWKKISPEERRKMHSQFARFFDLPAKEQDKTIRALPEADRREMERSLEDFAKLPPAQRKACIESFGKLAQMNPEERRQFLRNAERWQAMSPQERSTWRTLVRALPPMPPLPKALMPPTPAAPRRPQPATDLTVLSNADSTLGK